MNESELVAGLVSGSPIALHTFYRTYRARILGVARGIVRDEWDAEEVVQDVVWIVHRKLGDIDGDVKLWPWVYRVTQNASRMLLRKRRRIPIPIDGDELHSIVNRRATGPTPDAVAEQRATAEELQRCFDSLAPVNREIFHQIDVVGNSKEEVSKALGVSVPALKTRLSRTRAALRERVRA